MALSCTWGGFADTDVDFTEFFGQDHTIAVRFMLQYPQAYTGPMLSVNGTGTFIIGQGDYFESPGSQTKLVLRIGSKHATHPVNFSAGTWHHLAVVRHGNNFTLYLDGKPTGTSLTFSGSGGPSGRLRFGKDTFDPALDAGGNQFYGFLDDVAVFDKVLSDSDIYSLASANHLSGTENGLHAGFVFGYTPPGGLPPKLTRPLTFSNFASIRSLSANRNNSADTAKLPLSSTSFMHLPCAPSTKWEVSQGYEGHISHNGYAAFCLDFIIAGKPMSESEGKPFYAAAAGEVNTVQDVFATGGPSNFITVRQAPHEFADYLHNVDKSAEVNVGDRVHMGQHLADIGHTGTPQSHLHFAITNLGEGNKGSGGKFVTIPAPLCNYEASDDQGRTWHHLIRGIPTRGQWVRRSTIISPVRYAAVWESSTEGEFQVYGWSYKDYREKYDEIWPNGWRLKQLCPYVVDGHVRYSAVWEPSSEGEFQVYGWTYKDYRAKYDEIWEKGWRLKLLCPYVVNGDVRYTAVWKPSTEGEFQVYGWTYKDYREKYDEIWPKGWRLKLLCPYVDNGDVRYTAVWRPSTEGEFQVYGWKYADFRKKYDEIWPKGWRLKLLCPYVYNGKIRYTAVWRPNTTGEIQVYDWTYEDYRAMYDGLWNHRWRLKLLSPFVI